MPAMTDISSGMHSREQEDIPRLEDISESPSTSAMPPEAEGMLPADFGLSLDGLPPLECQGPNETAHYPSPLSASISDDGPMDVISVTHDIKDPHAVCGLAGLYNLGNTCFMNSGLQCLMNNPSLVNFFVEDNGCDADMRDSSLTGTFSALVQKLWSGDYGVIHPSSFKQVLSIYHPQFKDYRQHDCQEFLALLLDSFHEQLNQGSATGAKVLETDSDFEIATSPECEPYDSDCPDRSDPAGEDQSFRIQSGCSVRMMKRPHVEEEEEEAMTARGQSPAYSSFVLDSEVASYSGKPVIVADESNQSAASRETPLGDTSSHRLIPIPPTVKPFESPVQGQDEPMATVVMATTDDVSMVVPMAMEDNLIGAVEEGSLATDPAIIEPQGGEVGLGQISKETTGDVAIATGGEEGDAAAEDSVVDGERRLPSLEDLYMKDTKTLNTNVLATEFMVQEVAVDSEKFHKQDNTERATEADEFDVSHLNDLLAIDTTKGEGLKPYKETNLLANLKDKFSEDGCFASKCLFSEMEEMGRGEDSADGNSPPGEGGYSINNIKRMKIEEEEKNVRMQVKLKFNTDKNMTKEVNVNPRVELPAGELSFCASACGGATDLIMRGDCLVAMGGAGCSPGADGDPVGLGLGHLRRPGGPGGRRPRRVSEEREANPRMWAQHVRTAEREWKQYLARNQSVVVDTFQGQFKSTVVCSECLHVSVTFEPFMYLSLPLPRAMERQISVIFIPCDNKKPLRYLLTLNKQDTLRRLKQQLLTLVGEEACELTIAEVLDNHIARILDDNTMLRFVNDTNRTIYAFEMLLPPQDVTPEGATVSEEEGREGGEMDMAPNNMAATASGAASVSASQANADSHVLQNKLVQGSPLGGAGMVDKDGGGDGFRCTEEDMSGVEEYPDRLNNSGDNNAVVVTSLVSDSDIRTAADFQHNLFGAEEDGPQPGTSEARVGHEAGNEPGDGGGNGRGETESGDAGNQAEEEGEQEENRPSGADQWKSCAICLEEMLDGELMAHAACGGTLCHACLEMSFKHYGAACFMCPVCSTPANPTDDYVQLDSMADYKPKTRVLSVPVHNRYDTVEDGKPCLRLFGHPNILYLPSNLSGEYLYETVDRVVPCLSHYTVILTDGQGFRCSRCLYTNHCSGCELSREGDLNLQPGDHLTVRFSAVSPAQMEAASGYHDHETMASLRSKEPLQLLDCFNAFTESEVLDEHNPWYCPRCKRNQCAKKTMTVWRFPDTLVVYLKRFMFHDLSSTKIDSKVVFPLENLELSDFISGPPSSDLVYDLQSCVCHFGGVNSGHYTAYGRHAVNQDWHYFNDETVTKMAPRDDDYSNVYVLFYQRQGTGLDVKVPDAIKASGHRDLPYEGLSLTSAFPSIDSATYPSASTLTEQGGRMREPLSEGPLLRDAAVTSAETGQSEGLSYDFYS